MRGPEILDRFETEGYVLALEDTEIWGAGPVEPSEDLRAIVDEDRDGLKATLLLAEPPAWLAKIIAMHKSGTKTPVRRTNEKGNPERYEVTVSVKNIAAAVAAAIGMPVIEWECIRPEVEEALR